MALLRRTCVLAIALVGCSEGATDAASSSGGGAAGPSSSSSGSDTMASSGTGSGGEAEWTVVPWWTGTCAFEYAAKPENAFPKLEWEACPGNGAGCERIETNWPSAGPSGIGRPSIRAAGSGYELGLVVVYPELERRLVYVDESGVTMAAYHVPIGSECQVLYPNLSEDGHWTGAQQLGDNGVSKYVFQPRGQLPSEAVVAPTTVLSQLQVGGDELFALQYDFATGLEIYDRKTNSVHPTLTSTSMPSFTDDAGYMLVYAGAQPVGSVWTRASAVYATLIDRSPNAVVSLQTDGQALAWIESPPQVGSDPWPGGTLYRSPMATTPAELVPTVVRAMPSVSPGTTSLVGAGYYAVATGERQYMLVRLSDGRSWTVDIPVDEFNAILNNLSFLDAKYIFYKTQTGIYRQRLDALGPGIPPT